LEMATTVNIEAPPSRLAHGLTRATWYTLFFLVGFSMRFGFVLLARTYEGSASTMTPFGAEVCRIAAHIAAGKGFRSPFYGGDTGPTAWVAPVYPYLVAAVFYLFGAYTKASALVLLGLQCAMAASTGIAIWALGSRTLGERSGFWAAWIWTLSPIFFRWPCAWIWDFAASGLLLATVLVLSLDAGAKPTTKKWLGLGALWGLIGLANPALLSILPFSFLHSFLAGRKVDKASTQKLVYALVAFGVVTAPWFIRNEMVFGQPVFLRDNYWFEFSMGNFHYSNGMGYMGKHPDANPRYYDQVARLGELSFIALHRKEAFDFIRQYPREFVDLTLHRIWWFWDGTPLLYQGREWWSPWEFWPLSAVGWLGLLFVLTRRPSGWLLFAAALIVYPIPYDLAYANAKYRYAIEPELLLLGAYLLAVAWGEFTIRGLRRSAA
jgi:4-amino-4-deoxy-L-arabinose transferase-like glycosyltransferase